MTRTYYFAGTSALDAAKSEPFFEEGVAKIMADKIPGGKVYKAVITEVGADPEDDEIDRYNAEVEEYNNAIDEEEQSRSFWRGW